MQIVFAGSIAFDYLMTFPGHFHEHILADNLHNLSLSFLVDKMTRHRGGTAPNIAYSHALLGGNATILGSAGQDFNEYRHFLERSGVNTIGIQQHDDLFTASFFVNTDRGNCQLASFYSGAMARASECYLVNLPTRPDLVVVSPDDPTAMREHVRECKDLGIPYCYDPSQQIVRLDNADLSEGILGAKLVIVNEYEFGLLESRLNIAVDTFTRQNTILVVTQGSHGSVVYADGGEHHAPAFPTHHIVDPTGAGDAFRGGFLRGLALRLPWVLCAEMGSLAATYCLEHNGPQGHYFTPAEFVQRFRTVFNDNGALTILL
jgi:adenosine kinase